MTPTEAICVAAAATLGTLIGAALTIDAQHRRIRRLHHRHRTDLDQLQRYARRTAEAQRIATRALIGERDALRFADQLAGLPHGELT